MSTTAEEATIVSKELGPSSNIYQLTFGVALPQSVGHETNIPEPIHHMMNDAGIVGSILVLKNAAMIWLGWGHVDSRSSSTTVEGRGIPSMGSVVVGFPRTQYKGSGSGEAACSQLLGGDSEDQILGWQMAGRLSQQLGYPIFVSCALFAADPPEWMAGLDKAVIAQRGAAMAERKVRQLLKEQPIHTK
jgi:Proteasome assembly chaperone 4